MHACAALQKEDLASRQNRKCCCLGAMAAQHIDVVAGDVFLVTAVDHAASKSVRSK